MVVIFEGAEGANSVKFYTCSAVKTKSPGFSIELQVGREGANVESVDRRNLWGVWGVAMTLLIIPDLFVVSDLSVYN